MYKNYKKQFEDELESTLFYLFEKTKLLDILENFIVFEKKKETQFVIPKNYTKVRL